jgi:hypothetical protein
VFVNDPWNEMSAPENTWSRDRLFLSAEIEGTFLLAAPNADGVSTLTGNGTCIGISVVQEAKCTYTLTGTHSLHTTVFTAKVTGSYTSLTD